MAFRTRWILPLALGALGLPACDYGEDEDDGNDDSTVSGNACSDEDRADAFATGLSKDGTSVRVTVADAVPASPIRGDNTWTLMVTTLGGEPIDGAIVTPRPWMPDHGHGSSVQAEVREMGGGEYEVDPLNLFMAGLWEVTFQVEDPEGTANEVMIAVCVE